MRFQLVVLIIVCFALGSFIAWFMHAPHAISPSYGSHARKLIPGRFQLINHKGKNVSENTYRGKLRLVYFCYTNSPGICPAGLQILSATLEKIPEHQSKVAVLFITIDPSRDTLDKVGAFLKPYHPQIVGLTGSASQVRQAARNFQVQYIKYKPEAGRTDYLIRHTTHIFLMDRNGKYLFQFNHGTHPESIAKAILKYL